jgi:hypothetical protein
MSDTFKCAWCGRHFEKSAGAKFLSGASMGFSNLGKKYCSKSCEHAADEAKNGPKTSSSNNSEKQSNKNDDYPTGANASGGETTTVVNKAPGFGHFMGKALGDTISKSMSLSDKFDQQDREKAAKIEDLAQMKMSSDKEELLEQLNYLASLASSKPEKEIKNVIIEKMEFGIMKLKSSGANGEADFFEKKLEPLKKKGWF